MSKIRVLTSDVSNKIAAGEVVENAASVIKELIENAIDAGADSIIAEIKNGGVAYIRITDNGSGMAAEDAKNAFLRHATSKISSADDLERINTLGFRGEALASIAAVSNVELMTKTADGEGVLLELSAGKIINEQPVGCPDGTTIVIKDLFFNTPARMKFLKTDKTETSYVTDIVQRLILGNPGISVKYIVDGKERLFYGGDGQIKACVYSVYGREYAKGALEINRNENNIQVFGVAGKGETSRGNRSFQSFFLNGRYIKSRPLTYAAEAAYKNILMTGRFPFFVIHLKISPLFADVNVHPSKQEVKFANERAVCDEVYWAVKNALASQDVQATQDFTPVKPRTFTGGKLSEPARQTQMPDVKSSLRFVEQIFSRNIKEDDDTGQAEKTYKIVGQLFDTYIISQFQDKIILIDQHAAHERLIFEQIKKAYMAQKPLEQMLLSPVAITLSPEEFTILFEKLELFTQMGFEIEDFGNNSILIRQTPTQVGEDGLKGLITELIKVLSIPGDSLTRREDKMLEMISCKAAIKGNSRLHQKEIDALISEALNTGGISTCPHGRPLAITITKYELEKMFKRIV